MGLTAALTTARSSLQATATQISVSGKNVAGASDPSYSRKLAPTSTTEDGVARIVSVRRATDSALYFNMLGATSKAASQQAKSEGLERLAATIGDPQDEQSPAAKLTALTAALQLSANQPDDPALAQDVVSKAVDLAGTLNAAAATVADVRKAADDGIATSVSTINSLLAKLETLNNAVVQGTFEGKDVTDALDRRDATVASLSEEIGISVVTRANNDIVIYADGGATLFETKARSVTFKPTQNLADGTAGNSVFIDGVAVTGESASMPVHGGRLVGYATMRDEVALTYQTQLDETARGLIEAFAEKDQVGGGPDLAGLFTSGSPSLPASGTLEFGLASRLRVNAAVNPAEGGNLALLRDGGINGASYRYNPLSATGYSERLSGLVAAVGAERTFDPTAELGSTARLTDFTQSSGGWLELLRQTTASDVEYQSALVTRASNALSNATGVNLDDEYALQLQLEQSYAAASKLIGVVNTLFDSLLGAVG